MMSGEFEWYDLNPKNPTMANGETTASVTEL
jgi:hypothetical protein